MNAVFLARTTHACVCLSPSIVSFCHHPLGQPRESKFVKADLEEGEKLGNSSPNISRFSLIAGQNKDGDGGGKWHARARTA